MQRFAPAGVNQCKDMTGQVKNCFNYGKKKSPEIIPKLCDFMHQKVGTGEFVGKAVW